MLGLLLVGALIAIAVGRRRTVSTAVMSRWSRTLCRVMGVRITVLGTPHAGTALLVANHISWLDIFCIAAVCPTHFLAKQEVAAWPLFGWLCRRAGTAFIRRGSENGAGEAAEQLTWRLRQGGRILIFPEGTSTSGESVKRFYPRLFQAALHARCPVQAIALRYPDPNDPLGINRTVPFIGNDEFISHLWRLLGEQSIAVELSFSERVVAGTQTRGLLARHTYQQVYAALQKENIPQSQSISALPH
ncbi:MAG: 1-acyl-sn-glycerol-3-phosphate acyltransferase [Candidatus Competibacteraceae bacterium]|nr:1-acyl-sn-glycerol-3-phosphate acyltransferase [Candidatus Competibacteraceae bacterium]